MATSETYTRNRDLERRLRGPVYPVARFLLSFIFIAAGFSKLFDPSGTLAYMGSAGLPQSNVFYWVITAIELVGGFLLLFGIQERIVAWILAAYLVPVSFIFHTRFGDSAQIMNFLKNMAIIGGLLQVEVVGRVVSLRTLFRRELTDAKVHELETRQKSA